MNRSRTKIVCRVKKNVADKTQVYTSGHTGHRCAQVGTLDTSGHTGHNDTSDVRTNGNQSRGLSDLTQKIDGRTDKRQSPAKQKINNQNARG